MNWVLYFVLALVSCGGYYLLGYIGRKTYNHVTEGRR